jgi:hypothetical protein
MGKFLGISNKLLRLVSSTQNNKLVMAEFCLAEVGQVVW